MSKSEERRRYLCAKDNVPNENPGGQRKVTRAEFNTMSPRAQGYVAYMQAEWNPEIPGLSPYPPGTREYVQWLDGNNQACMAVQDMDDD